MLIKLNLFPCNSLISKCNPYRKMMFLMKKNLKDVALCFEEVTNVKFSLLFNIKMLSFCINLF